MSGAQSLATPNSRENPYLIDSPHAADRGQKIGNNPAFLSAKDLQGVGAPRTPNKAIRAHCVTCSGGSYAEANKCTATGCALWVYRMGRNPFYGGANQKGGPNRTHKITAPQSTEIAR